MASTKLTDDVQARIVQALTAGNYLDTAAAYAGVSRVTVWRWMQRGEEEADNPDSIYSNFRNAVESARAQAEVRSVALISRAADDGTWQAAAWFLERSYPNRWARVQRTEISGPDGAPVNLKVDAKVELMRVLGLDGDDDAAVDV
jgi:hypothetical protein